MNPTLEMAATIIDICLALMEYRQGLSDEQVGFVHTMHRRAVEFIETFLDKQVQDPRIFASYLNHDALSPITVIIGYAEVFVTGMMGELDPAYQDAFQEIADNGYAIREDISAYQQYMREALVNLGLRDA